MRQGQRHRNHAVGHIAIGPALEGQRPKGIGAEERKACAEKRDEPVDDLPAAIGQARDEKIDADMDVLGQCVGQGEEGGSGQEETGNFGKRGDDEACRLGADLHQKEIHDPRAHLKRDQRRDRQQAKGCECRRAEIDEIECSSHDGEGLSMNGGSQGSLGWGSDAGLMRSLLMLLGVGLAFSGERLGLLSRPRNARPDGP